MNIKIRTTTGVTENNGEWRIKRNGANVEEEKLREIVRVMSGSDNRSIASEKEVKMEYLNFVKEYRNVEQKVRVWLVKHDKSKYPHISEMWFFETYIYVTYHDGGCDLAETVEIQVNDLY